MEAMLVVHWRWARRVIFIFHHNVQSTTPTWRDTCVLKPPAERAAVDVNRIPADRVSGGVAGRTMPPVAEGWPSELFRS
jgi:hypothetical protein